MVVFSAGLTVAVVCGFGAGVIALILVFCYKRWKRRHPGFKKSGFAAFKKRPCISHPPIPQPPCRTDTVSTGDSGMRAAQEYVEESKPGGGHSPATQRRLLTRQSMPVLHVQGDTDRSPKPEKRSSVPPSLATLGKTQSLLIPPGGTPPTLKRGARHFSTPYDPLNIPEDEEDDAFEATSSLSCSGLQSAASDTAEESSELGEVQFRLEPYQFETRTVRFHLIRAKNLQSKNFGGTSDPFVVVHLTNASDVLPSGEVVLDKAELWRSKTHLKTSNPVFEEHHDFSCPSVTELMQKAILVQVFDHDRFSRKELIGHAWLPLSNVDVSNIPTFCKALRPGKKVVKVRG